MVLGATFFADDLHFCDVIARETDLDSFLHKAGKLFLHLQKFNMLINYKKFAVLMHLKGACAKRWRKHHVFHREGGQFLRIRVGEAIAFLPIKTIHKYLGIVLSYQAYEKATVLHRLAQSKAAYHRLRPVLTSKSTLNQRERLRVWQVCVLSCLRYGLDSIPLTQGLLKLIQVQCARQIRAITRSPVHLSREPTARLYARLHIPTELAHLRGIQAKQLPEAQSRQVQCESFCLEQMDWLMKVNAAYEQLQEPLPPVASTVPDSASASTTALVPLPLATRGQGCPVCGLYFKDKTGVKIHMTRKHLDSQEVPKPLCEQSRCGVDGMPTCAACRRPFSSWGALKQHVLGGHCRLPMPEQTPLDNLPLQQHPLVIETVRTQGWQGLLALRLVRERALHFCPLCNQWCVNPSGVKVHLQDVHLQWHDLQPRIKQIASFFRRGMVQPCRYCGSRHAARCPVISASILLGSLLAERDGGSQCEGDGSLLWQLPAGDCADGGLRESLQTSPRDGGGGVEGMELPEAQEQGQGQGAWEKWWQERTDGHFRRAMPGGITTADGTADPEARGSTESPTSRLGSPSVAEKHWRGTHCGDAVGGVQKVEEDARHHASSTSGIVEGYDDGWHVEGPEGPSPPGIYRREAAGECEKCATPGCAGSLGVPSLGPRAGEASSGRQSHTPENRGDSTAAYGLREGQRESGAVSLPCEGRVQLLGVRALRNRSGSPGSGGSGPVSKPEGAVPVFGFADHRCSSSQRQTGTVCSSTEDSGLPSLNPLGTLPFVDGGRCVQCIHLGMQEALRRSCLPESVMHTCGLAWLVGTLWIFTYLRGPCPRVCSVCGGCFKHRILALCCKPLRSGASSKGNGRGAVLITLEPCKFCFKCTCQACDALMVAGNRDQLLEAG